MSSHEPTPTTLGRAAGADIATAVVEHFHSARRDLPWRRTRDPYAIWVSEIMLQQTRVATVIPYFKRWMERFPTVSDLACAQLDDVLAQWSGLGYYTRARNLHRGAIFVVQRAGGSVPRTLDGLLELPGVGPYTAGAIASIAFGLREPVVDGNVARVLARVFELEGNIKSSASIKQLWSLAKILVPEDKPGDFNQGLMELGATICTPRSPVCLICPLHHLCRARQAGRERELPHMPKRKAAASLPLIDASALWIERGGRVLLARRSPTGLYGGLWELPQIESDAQPARIHVLLRALVNNIDVDTRVPVYEHKQTLTHRRLRIRVYLAKPRSRARKPPNALGKLGHERYDKLAWQAIMPHAVDSISHGNESGELGGRLGISAATKTIINAFLETFTWNSTKKPSRSSTKGTKKSSKDSTS